ncbi:MAG: hypothetical protein JNL82_37305 [Myxococcales bacterium]|nr:hypothetical protein [Myxococcales bacterium]
MTAQKYDDASWHTATDFPAVLSHERATTHIGMFFGWIVDRGLVGPLLTERCADELARFKAREFTGPQLLRACCDDQLTDDWLDEVGDAFAAEYYASSSYYHDYDDVLGGGMPTLFHVEDT